MILSICGHCRNVGKTAVGAALIAALPEFSWTALKVSLHAHGLAEDSEPLLISETEAGSTDSGRYLAAGACESYWLRVPGGRVEAAEELLQPVIASSVNLIVEGNSFALACRSNPDWPQPDLTLLIADFANPDFKDSAFKLLPSVSAVVARNRKTSSNAWPPAIAIAFEDACRKLPVFDANLNAWAVPELIELVRSQARRQVSK